MVMNEERKGRALNVRTTEGMYSIGFFSYLFKTTTQKMCIHSLCLLFRSHIQYIVHFMNSSSSRLSLHNFLFITLLFFFIHMGIFATFIRSYVKSIPFFSCFLTPCVACRKLAVRLIALLKKKNSRWLLLRIYVRIRKRERKRSRFPLFWPRCVSDARKKKYEKRVCSDVRLST
jgi:hypothetical protein